MKKFLKKVLGVLIMAHIVPAIFIVVGWGRNDVVMFWTTNHYLQGMAFNLCIIIGVFVSAIISMIVNWCFKK